jgi:hypothetical protein
MMSRVGRAIFEVCTVSLYVVTTSVLCSVLLQEYARRRRPIDTTARDVDALASDLYHRDANDDDVVALVYAAHVLRQRRGELGE